jgi:pyrimidine operon attenuation protein/uracil phosphoribosyltransferase
VGKKIITNPQEEVTVTFRELEGQDRVVVQETMPV